MNKNQRFVITIGRERGSGGRMVGKELARRFHIHYYDREILACASKELNVDEAYLASIDERSMNFMQNVFPVAYGGNSMAFNYVTTEAELIGVQSRLICEFASSRSCVIVGRCADYLLRDNPNCIRIFLSSDMEDRIDHIADIYGVSKDEAKKKIKKMDKDRAKYYRSGTGMEGGDARTYDLCLNTSLLGIEKSCDLVEHAVRIFLQSRGIDPDANQEE